MVELKRLVRQAAGGDERAAGVLFDAYHPRVLRFALAKLGDRTDAEDIAAEAFARVLGELDRFRWTGGGFEAWLFRIASNLVVDLVRRRDRERATDEVPLPEEREAWWTPEGRLLAGEQSAQLRAMLGRLPEEQREVLLLRFAAGLDTKETGAVMSKKANAIRQLQFRALEGMRAMMAEGAGAR
jgi:RNA polymerase sigma-70 factor (ECF subfamily)